MSLSFKLRNNLTKNFFLKSEAREKSRSRSRSRSQSPKAGSAHDFERFRNDILGAIE